MILFQATEHTKIWKSLCKGQVIYLDNYFNLGGLSIAEWTLQHTAHKTELAELKKKSLKRGEYTFVD